MFLSLFVNRMFDVMEVHGSGAWVANDYGFP